MTAHSLLLVALLVVCIVVELHPRIRTGLTATLLLGTLAMAALLRLAIHTPAALPEYLLIGAAIGLVIALARSKLHPPRPADDPFGRWHITP